MGRDRSRRFDFESAMRLLGDRAEPKPEGYAVDRHYPAIVYVPENAEFNGPRRLCAMATRGRLSSDDAAAGAHLRVCRRGTRYASRNSMAARPGAWWAQSRMARYVTSPARSRAAENRRSPNPSRMSYCRARSLSAITTPTWTRLAEILAKDFSQIYTNPPPEDRAQRPLLSMQRSLGSVVKLLTASPEYTDRVQRMAR